MNSIKLFLTLLSVFFPFYINALTPPSTPTQHLADKPKDRPLAIVTEQGDTLCYIPTFSIGAQHSSYIGILNCSLPDAIPARYDVFGRIAFHINDNWLCLTAPYDVAVSRRTDKDYLYLSPCVINADLQQWKLQDGKFYAHDGSYSIKDDGSFLYAAHELAGGLSTHTLAPSMQEWANTKATPAGINLILTLAWDLEHKEGRETYFLYNNASDKNSRVLFYNPVSGHIAEYNELSGQYQCMYSNTDKKNWDWVSWGLCTDAPPPQENRAFFKFVPISETNFAIEDKDGNVLRVTRYGIHWGVPYVASKKYINTDTNNNPTSSFRTTEYMRLWLRFVNANIGKNLYHCPAPGYESKKPSTQKALKKEYKNENSQTKALLNNSSLRTQILSKTPLQSPPQQAILTQQFPPAIPTDFRLTMGWINRLYAINTTANQDQSVIGICGVCILQAFQMIAELLENPYTPRQSGGYFFDTAYRSDPFLSFRARNSILHDTLEDIMEYYNNAPIDLQYLFTQAMDRVMASSISLLPQYEWSMVGHSMNPTEMYTLLERIINAPVGSVFLVVLGRFNDQTQRNSWHAVPILILDTGAIAIPTNVPRISLQPFIDRLAPSHTREQLQASLTRFGTGHLRLTALGVLEIRRTYANPYEGLISMRDCSGDGEDRRGSGTLPLPELINQCISGRCEW